jgi:transposase-like protein
MARKYRKFSPEFRDEAVRLVIDGSRPIAQVARELGVNEGTLGNWVNQHRKCAWLSVSASGFFDWRQRPNSATARRRQRLCALIREAFESSDETYGYRRIHAQLNRWGGPMVRNSSAASCASWAYSPASPGLGGPA